MLAGGFDSDTAICNPEEGKRYIVWHSADGSPSCGKENHGTSPVAFIEWMSSDTRRGVEIMGTGQYYHVNDVETRSC